MEDSNHDWDALASELVRQNYAFVVAFAAIIWDCSITFRQEVKYIWHCPSSMTKYLFLICRYYAIGYILMSSIFGTHWTLRFSNSSKDCTTWFLVHKASISVLYSSSHLSLIRKVFNLYGRSTGLAFVLCALHCTQIVGSFILSHRVSASLDFNPICNGRNVPKSVLSILAAITFNQCIIWFLILRKVWVARPKFLNRRAYLATSDTYTSAICLFAVLFCSSRSVTHQHLSLVYVFTLPMIMISIGTCRYMLQAEKDRVKHSKLAEDAKSKKQSHLKAEPSPNGREHPHPSQSPEAVLSPLLHPEAPEALSIRTSDTQAGRHYLDTILSSSSLHGAQSYKLDRSRKSLATTATNESPQSSSDCTRQRPLSSRTSVSRGSSLGTGALSHVGTVDSTNPNDPNSDWEETQSASDIEIGSLHSTTTVNSEELREFYNDAWNVGPFMVGGP